MSNESSLPPYTYTPGVTPHPIRDPAGHSHGRLPHDIVVDAARVEQSAEFQRGIELFQHGYYWEAHEEWEAVWHALGRKGTASDFVKGLIKLAAAGVKAREGNADGVRRHVRRAVELLRHACDGRDAESLRGLHIEPVVEEAKRLAELPAEYTRLGHGRPVVLWPGLAEKLTRL